MSPEVLNLKASACKLTSDHASHLLCKKATNPKSGYTQQLCLAEHDGHQWHLLELANNNCRLGGFALLAERSEEDLYHDSQAAVPAPSPVEIVVQVSLYADTPVPLQQYAPWLEMPVYRCFSCLNVDIALKHGFCGVSHSGKTCCCTFVSNDALEERHAC